MRGKHWRLLRRKLFWKKSNWRNTLESEMIKISGYLVEIWPHRVLCLLQCWFSGCLWSPLRSGHLWIPGWRRGTFYFVAYFMIRCLHALTLLDLRKTTSWVEDSRWDRGRGWRCAAVPTAAAGSGRAARKGAGKANRSWPAGSETFTCLERLCEPNA